MKKPNTRARTEAALRAARPLAATAIPATGDVLWINGTPFKLTSIMHVGRGPARHFRFTDPKGNVIDVEPGERRLS